MPKINYKFLQQRLIKQSDQCVLCGLCLPHCPTYNLLKQEPDAPRGRISLMRAASLGQLPFDHSDALARCLGCGSCESVCPAEAPYLQMLDDFRALQRQKSWRSPLYWPITWLEKLGQWLLFRPKRLEKLWPLLRRFGQLLPQAGFLKKIKYQPMRYQNFYPAKLAQNSEKVGEVAIFLGCVSRLWQGEALAAGIQLLQEQGFAVHIPENQGCCGALAAHSGQASSAQACQIQNYKAFAKILPQIQAILTIDSGCGQYLQSQASLERTSPENFNLKVKDLLIFLLEQAHFRKRLPRKLASKEVLLHVPCSQENRGGKILRQLFQNAEQLPAGCCGGAGSYFLKQPKVAKALQQKLWSNYSAQPIKQLLSSNIGCALHWANLETNQDVSIEHPLVFMARELTNDLSSLPTPLQTHLSGANDASATNF